MIPESIRKKREKVFAECRELMIKVNGGIQKKSQESESPEKTLIQSTGENNQEYGSCDCCQTSDIPDEKMTSIESGQRLCPECLSVFCLASIKQSLLI